MKEDDRRIRTALAIAENAGPENNIREERIFERSSEGSAVLKLKGYRLPYLEIQENLWRRASIYKIKRAEANFQRRISDAYYLNVDQPGHIAEVTSMLSHKSVNVAEMQLYREESRGGDAVMVIESCDEEIPQELKWLEHLRRPEGHVLQSVERNCLMGGVIMSYLIRLKEICKICKMKKRSSGVIREPTTAAKGRYRRTSLFRI